MTLVRFHHLNVVSPRVDALRTFYMDVLELTELPGMGDQRIRETYAGDVAFLEAGEAQLHLGNPDPTLGERAGHTINPMARGHLAFRTDDLDAVKRNLTKHGVPFADYGVWGMNGWHQIFFEDPNGNVVEVHQVVGD